MFNIKGDVDKIVGQLPFVAVKKDLGATFANVATELAKYVLDASTPMGFAIMENTNATGAGVRFYVYAPGTGWKYVAVA